MIQPFVDRFMAAEPEMKARLVSTPPENYDDLVKRVVEVVRDPDEYSDPDPERIHIIDDGDYQGTRLYVIAGSGYQPDNYWRIFVNYGSCSGCDAFEDIIGYSDEPLSETQVNDLWTLMLHMVQDIRPLHEETDK